MYIYIHVSTYIYLNINLSIHLLKSRNLQWFENFNETRYSDVEALGSLALYLNETNSIPSHHPEKISRLCFTILQSLCKELNIFAYTYEDLTFGPQGKQRLPYGYIVGMWRRRKAYLLPLCRGFVYPLWLFFYLLSLLCLPFKVLLEYCYKKRV